MIRQLISLILLFSSLTGISKGEFVNDSLRLYESLSEALVDSPAVKQLSLRRSKLNAFPLEVLRLSNLEYLDLSKNKLDSLPAELSQLKHLKVLILSKNQFSTLPSVVYELKNLEVLLLGNNEFTYISPDIGNLVRLKHLDFWSTNVFELPAEISRLQSLEVLDLRGISLNRDQQAEIVSLLPSAKIFFSPPCNCNF